MPLVKPASTTLLEDLVRIAATRLAGGLVFAIAAAICLPIAWVTIGLVVGLAYAGNPVLEGWWLGPAGLLGHVLGTVVFSAVAGAFAAQLLVGRPRSNDHRLPSIVKGPSTRTSAALGVAAPAEEMFWCNGCHKRFAVNSVTPEYRAKWHNAVPQWCLPCYERTTRCENCSEKADPSWRAFDPDGNEMGPWVLTSLCRACYTARFPFSTY
jgi:hypothetical protein